MKWVEDVEYNVGDKVYIPRANKVKFIEKVLISEAENERPFYLMDDNTTYWSNEIFHCDTEVGEKSEPAKYNEGKPMMSLVRPEFIEGIAEVLTYGAVKYDENRGSEPNYMQGEGFHYSTIYDSLQRHLNAFWKGESIDPESGKNHLLHAASNLMFLYMYEISNKGKDDRYEP